MPIPPSFLRVLLGVYACLGSANPGGAVVRYLDSRAAPGGDGLSWGTAYDSLSTALTPAQSGDQIWVAAGRYVGNFTLKLRVELYGGFAGTETELTQRNYAANPTILDGNQTGSVVASPQAEISAQTAPASGSSRPTTALSFGGASTQVGGGAAYNKGGAGVPTRP